MLANRTRTLSRLHGWVWTIRWLRGVLPETAAHKKEHAAALPAAAAGQVKATATATGKAAQTQTAAANKKEQVVALGVAAIQIIPARRFGIRMQVVTAMAPAMAKREEAAAAAAKEQVTADWTRKVQVITTCSSGRWGAGAKQPAVGTPTAVAGQLKATATTTTTTRTVRATMLLSPLLNGRWEQAMCIRPLAAAKETAEATGLETLVREWRGGGVADRQAAKEPAVGAPAMGAPLAVGAPEVGAPVAVGAPEVRAAAAAAGQLKVTATATTTTRRGGAEPAMETPIPTRMTRTRTRTSRSLFGDPCLRLESGIRVNRMLLTSALKSPVLLSPTTTMRQCPLPT